MAQVTFGTVLQEARERKGMDLSSAARRLRIRPDILRAIEEDDFTRMPPRGYTRNMVNAYARLLGLNPTEITRMYLDEAYAYQVGRARSDVKPAGFDMGDASRAKRSPRTSRQDEPDERVPRQNAFGRTLYDDRTAYTRPDYGRGEAPAAGGGRLYSEDRTHTSRHTALPNGQYTNFYAGPKAPSGVQSKLPFIIAGAVVLAVLVIVLVFAFGGKGGGDDEVPSVPVTGLTDTTQGEDQGQEPAPAPVEVAPTKAVLGYEVASGESAYIETYVGDSDEPDFSQEVAGPAKETIDVDTKLTLFTPNPDAVTLTLDGTAVELTDDDEDGLWSYTVDFAAVLEQWKAAHPTAGAGAASGTGTGVGGTGTTDGA